MYLKKGDEVMVIAGSDKGCTGTVVKILPNNKVIVSGIGVCKKHQKSQGGMDGGIIDIERPIDASNLSLFDEKTNKPSRVKFDLDKDGNKTRKLVKTNKEI